MSGKRSKTGRFWIRLCYGQKVSLWLDREPSMWRIWAWHRWKAARPLPKDREERRAIVSRFPGFFGENIRK